MSLTNQIKFIYVERERIKQIHQPTIQPSNEQTKKKKFQLFVIVLAHTSAWPVNEAVKLHRTEM